MKFKLFGFVAFVAASLFSLNIATAAPLSQVIPSEKMAEALEANPNIVNVKGCHSNKKWHMVYKWGKKKWHRHGYNCQPKHVVKKKWGHCHKNWKKHWHKGHGKNWHRHAGPGCHYQYGKTHHHYKKKNNCIKVGPLWVCQ